MRPQFSVHRLMLFTAKTYPNFVRIDQFLRDLQPKQIFRQSNFKLSYDNKINNDIQLKRNALKVYVHAYKFEHSFNIYREIKVFLLQKSKKKISRKIFQKI